MRRMGNRTMQREECHMWLSIWDRGLFKCQVCMRIWYLNVSCCVSRGFLPIRPCALCHSDDSEGCRLILHAMSGGFDHPGSLKLVIALWYLWICCQHSCLFPLMANLASNDVMQWNNDALHSQHLFAHCLLSKAEGMCPLNVYCSNKSLHKVIPPSMRTYCTSVSPQSSWNTPTATHLPPVIAAVSYISVKVSACCREKRNLQWKVCWCSLYTPKKSLLRDLSMRLWMCRLCSLSVVLSSKVCIVSEGLISLSLCTHISLLSSRGSHRMETKQWGQIDLERELPTRPLNFVTPKHPT